MLQVSQLQVFAEGLVDDGVDDISTALFLMPVM
jgi:hypothetical protein